MRGLPNVSQTHCRMSVVAVLTTWSAPRSFSFSSLASDPEHAITSAPSDLASCTHAVPTPPAAPRTITLWPGPTGALTFIMRNAVA